MNDRPSAGESRPEGRADARARRIQSLGLLAATALIAGATLLRRDARPDNGEREADRDARSRLARETGSGTRSSGTGASDRPERARSAGKTPDRPDPDRDPAHGRLAETPRQIPKAGWMDIAKRVARDFSRDRLMAVAAGVTFYVLLALFPAIAAFVSLYGLVFSPEQVADQLQALEGLLPAGAIDVLDGEISRIAGQTGGTLGVAFAGGLLVALWSANAGMKAIFDALNVVYDEEEKRGFIVMTLVTLGFTIAAMLVIGAFVASVAFLPAFFAAVPMGVEVERLLSWLRFPIALVLIAAVLALLYRYAPSRTRPRWRWVAWGAVIGAVAWVGFSMVFSWYVSNFGAYNATYGSLGAVVGFMVWIWLSTTIVLLAAELNAEMERQTAEDTTDRPIRPLGERGARAADTVAPRG